MNSGSITADQGSQGRWTQPARALHPGFERAGMAIVVIWIFCASVQITEPSPYEFVFLLALGYWVMVGVRFSRVLIVPVILLILYNLGGFFSLIPYFHEADPVMFMIQSAYLAVTTLLFMCIFGTNTEHRVELALKAYTASCLFAASLGILGYFDIGGTRAAFATYGRASGPFQDPNVYGSFIIVGALYLMHNVLLGRARSAILSLAGALIILVGVLLSGSRGSWGATILGTMMMVGFTFITSRSGLFRRRILVIGFVTIGIAVSAILVALSFQEVRDLFELRASVTQDYDEGPTGRFGQQMRSIPMLIEMPNGMGPLRFRLFNEYDPHSSYINAFASYGWLGGFSFLLLVGSSIYVGFRLCLRASPVQRQAQIAFPALLMFFLQGFQIDIDHWRHVYILLGIVWALEAARLASAHAPFPYAARREEVAVTSR